MSFTQVVLKKFGGPEELDLRTVEDLPEPKPGEVRIRVLVTSAAFTDVMIRKGMYPDVKEKPPFVPGYDLVGVVDALGPGVDGLASGDRVADLTTIGAYSEYLCVPAAGLTKVPEGVADEDALAMILSAVTPYQMLHRVARAKAGQSLRRICRAAINSGLPIPSSRLETCMRLSRICRRRPKFWKALLYQKTWSLSFFCLKQQTVGDGLQMPARVWIRYWRARAHLPCCNAARQPPELQQVLCAPGAGLTQRCGRLPISSAIACIATMDPDAR
jgi:hypothetical protein